MPKRGYRGVGDEDSGRLYFILGNAYCAAGRCPLTLVLFKDQLYVHNVYNVLKMMVTVYFIYIIFLVIQLF